MKRTALIVVGAPVLIGVLGPAVFLAIRSDLPDPVATHWGTSGPDGFTALGRVVLPLLIGPVIGLLVGVALGWFGRREPVARRMAAAFGTGTAAAGGWGGGSGSARCSPAARRCR